MPSRREASDHGSGWLFPASLAARVPFPARDIAPTCGGVTMPPPQLALPSLSSAARRRRRSASSAVGRSKANDPRSTAPDLR